MPRVKGVAILGLVKFIKKNLKGMKFEEVVKSMPEQDREVMSRRILTTEWYPYSTFINLLFLIDRHFGKGDLSFAREQGRLSAEHDLSGIYKPFLRLGPVKFMMKRAMNVWNSYYDTGTMEVFELEGGKFGVRLKDFPEVARIHCKNIEGWIEKYVELCGIKGARVYERKCRSEGADCCEFIIEGENL